MADERSQRPWWLLLLMLVVGPYAFLFTGGRSGAPPASIAAGLVGDVVDETPQSEVALRLESNLRVLRPLAEVAVKPKDAPPKDLTSLLNLLDVEHFGSVESMIICLPDADRTSQSGEFDAYLAGVLRAGETRKLLLSRHRFPWRERLNEKGGTKPGESASGAPIRLEDEPAVVVFRANVSDPKTTGRVHQTLVAFLVAETPTRGINRAQLDTALTLSASIEKWKKDTNRPGGTRSTINQRCTPSADAHFISILGPTFSGSAPSFRDSLEAWRVRERETFGRVWFSIKSGSATSIRGIAPGQPFLDLPDTCYESMLYDRSFVIAAILDRIARWKTSYKVALLVESNTGFGQAYRGGPSSFKGRIPPNVQMQEYPFPLHIAELRASYEKRGLLGRESNSGGPRLTSADPLELAPEELRNLRDVVSPQTPEGTSLLNDLTLVQILTEIEKSDFDAVGILATSPRDIVFLGRRVRSLCPNTTLFATDGQLLFARSQTMRDLRGMIVGSTYPLYPPAQGWTGLEPSSARHVFGEEMIEGVFNVMLFHLGERFGNQVAIEAELLDYGRPFLNHAAAGIDRRPPVWVGIVGNRGIYPLQVEPIPSTALSPVAKATILGSVRPGVFRPSFHPLWRVLYLALLAAAVARSLWVLKTPLEQRQAAADEVTLVGRPLLSLCFTLVVLTLGWPFLQSILHSDGGDSLELKIWRVLTCATLAFSAFESFVSFGIYGGELQNERKWARLGPIVQLRRSRKLAFCIVVITMPMCVVFFGILWALLGNALRDWTDDARLAIERQVVVTSGVSPLFPMLFVAISIGAGSFALGRCRKLAGPTRIELFEPIRAPIDGINPYLETRKKIQGQRHSLKEMFERPWSLITHIWDAVIGRLATAGQIRGAKWDFRNESVVATMVWMTIFLVVFVVGFWRACFNGWLFQVVFWSAYLGGVTLLVYSAFLLYVGWRRCSRLLNELDRLPLNRAFSRLPSRLAKGLFDVPVESPTSVHFREETTALRCHTDKEIRATLAKIGIAVPPEDDWLDRPWPLANDNDYAAYLDQTLMPVLAPIWKGLPASWSHDDGDDKSWPIAPSIKQKLREKPAPADARAALLASALNPTSGDEPKGDAEARLRDWVELAENVLAMTILRWLGPLFSQLWCVIKFLVVCSVCLLLALNSFPFPSQEAIRTWLGVLIILVACVIIWVLIGINRDELVSHLSNTTPGRISFDGHFMGSLAQYILPLVFLLTALSVDVSEIVSTWLGPDVNLLDPKNLGR